MTHPVHDWSAKWIEFNAALVAMRQERSFVSQTKLNLLRPIG